MRWADAWHDRFGRWPKRDSGFIRDSWGEKWLTVDAALKMGQRGLPGGTSLALLLAEKRQAPHLRRSRRVAGPRPRLTVQQILCWADAHHARTGAWPHADSGPVVDAPHDETWRAVTAMLRGGGRGLPGGSSLAQLLARHRGVRNRARLPRLAVAQILAWADAHHKRAGTWPKQHSGRIEGAEESWAAVNTYLRRGSRGLRGGSSLAEFLWRHRHIANHYSRPQLTEELILAWAGEHFRRTGRWPTTLSGPLLTRPHEHWRSIDSYLRAGLRGLPGGSSLPGLLARRHGVSATPSRSETSCGVHHV